MNILYVISSLKHGGAEKQIVFDANVFSEKHKVFLITFSDGELRGRLSDNVKLIILKKKGYFSTAKMIEKIIYDNNIRIINASLFASMIISYLAARKKKISVFWYFHSHEYDIGLKSKILLKYIARFFIIKKLFFVSNELKNYFISNRYNFPPDKMEILYNTKTVNTDSGNFNEIKNKNIVIGYIGRLVELKRVEYLVDLAKYLKNNGINDFIIEIIGDGDAKQKLIEYMNNLELNSHIKFFGFRINVEEFYSEFDIFILPSREECLSIALIDASASSIPCIAFNVGGNDEIIENNKSGFIVKSKEEMFEKVKLLVSDEELRKKFGAEGKINCAGKFSVNKRKEYLERIFENIN